MEDDDDDFTFPTVVVSAAQKAAPPEGQLGHGHGDLPLQLPPPDLAAAPLWPFAASPKTNAPPPPLEDNEDQKAALVTGTTGRSERRAEAERRAVAVAADEERMDMLWESAAAATIKPPAPPRSAGIGGSGHAEPPPQLPPTTATNPKPRRAEAKNNDGGGEKQLDAERMDKLWESFNADELLLLRRGRTKSAAAADRPGGLVDPGDDHWFLCSYSPSDDAGSGEDTSLASSSSPVERRRGYGCAPTMLRASSRAGGAGQFCGGSPRGSRRRRGAAAGWALLLRLFRRLFAVDKAPASSRGHATIYVPRP
ncbi:hypothetical protein HU200_062620 [Digitaria exilis]|uniref:Uncharacterized protein n=1 Tax=Digitaria exilis TaxID=1010633 RepID=A0A835A617_9POAL|nr:hypothetical protein HU200_062620 [Digitaria exilis]